MTSAEFKSGLKQIKNELRGLSIQFITKNSVIPYNSLNEFGHAVLSAESNSNYFVINRIWTSEGIKSINSFGEFVEALKAVKVTGISFTAKYVASDFAEAMRLEGGLD